MKPKLHQPATPPPLPVKPAAQPAPPQAEPESMEELGFIVGRSKDRKRWQLTCVTRGPNGELKAETQGPMPRERFLLVNAHVQDRFKRFIWDRMGI